MAFEFFSDWKWWLIMVISILLLTLVLYLSIRLICGRKKFDGGYFLRLFLVSILLIVGVEAVAQALAAITSPITLDSMFYIFLTIGFILVIRYLLMVPAVLPHAESGDKYWQWAIWNTVVSLFLILAIGYIVFAISHAFNPSEPIYIFVPG
ncbi:MAG: hypothetical protein FK734_06305 [Asgard group archaeon]|nr:hypothetical protein [Asgard group archaeon]